MLLELSVQCTTHLLHLYLKLKQRKKLSNRIVTMGGDLLATSGTSSNDKMVGAIAVNIWSSYQKVSQDVNFLLLDCEVNNRIKVNDFIPFLEINIFFFHNETQQEGRVAVSNVTTQFLVCIYSDTKTEYGILKAKV